VWTSASLLGFVPRWDLYACQLDDGRHISVHEPLTVDRLFAHLWDEIALGTYLLSPESRARVLVLDADDEQGWERLGYLARKLADEDGPAYLEMSRHGGNLWFWLKLFPPRSTSPWPGDAGCAPS
jgi:hypothetical protein